MDSEIEADSSFIIGFSALKEFSDRLGPVYGTEDFCLFIHSLVKMQTPRRVLELGTGFGVTAFWIAKALLENGTGHLWTYDNGSHWTECRQAEQIPLTSRERALDFGQFIQHKIDTFALGDVMTFVPGSIPPFPTLDGPIEILFADFQHGPVDVLRLLTFYLPHMAAASSIFIDSASTQFATFTFLENLLTLLNRGKLPLLMAEGLEGTSAVALQERLGNTKFTLVHLTEAKDRAQNSTAWLKIEPIDLLPHPRTTMRF